jgi:hypothetical protein
MLQFFVRKNFEKMKPIVAMTLQFFAEFDFSLALTLT